MAKSHSPTLSQYSTLDAAFRFFNKKLFGGQLPHCLIVFEQKGKRTLGYYAKDRWQQRTGKGSLDEIAINPFFMRGRSDKEIISTLVHEMAHLWQFHFGKPSRNGYHNKQWGDKMDEIGLVPSSTGAPGGKRTGQQMTHYIQAGGLFDLAWAEFVAQGHSFEWVRLLEECSSSSSDRNKVKYSCPGCDLNAWAKPDVRIVCGSCNEELIPQ